MGARGNGGKTLSATQALRRESLVIKLCQAAEAARLREAEYQSGVADESEVLAAEEKRDLLQAQIDGHPARMLSIRLKTAREQAAMVEARYKAGEADQSELLAAQEKVDVLEAESEGDAVQAAKSGSRPRKPNCKSPKLDRGPVKFHFWNWKRLAMQSNYARRSCAKRKPRRRRVRKRGVGRSISDCE